MNEFENKLIIKEEPYKNGFFPKIPPYGKKGSAFLLTNGCDDDILVDDHTTVKQIRKGKYTQLVEISTRAYMKEISFQSPSEDTFYSFEVYVKAVIQVDDPLTYYDNKNIDIDAYFDNLFSLDVKKITQEYSILNYAGMDEELTRKLSTYNTTDDAVGIRYQISVVSAEPGKNAQEYVQKSGKQKLDAEMKAKAHSFIDNLSKSFEEAIMTEVIEGKMSEVEAMMKINEYKELAFEKDLSQINKLLEGGHITEKEASDYIKPALQNKAVKSLTAGKREHFEQNDVGLPDMDAFYPSEESF